MAAPATIAELDQQLIQLLGERARLLRETHEKTPSAAPTIDSLAVDPATATQVGLPVEALTCWLRHAASICQRQAAMREPVVFLGPIYSYSYLAAVKHFGMAADLVPVTTIAAAFDELVRGQAKYGVVPIENSTDGRVVDTLGMFARWPVQICGEVLLPVHHCLLGRCKRAEVTVVQSKPQALSQCRMWLSQHVPDAQLVEVASTAAAAALAAQTPGAAAIASLEAGLHHGLQVIDANIEDNSNNVTRFAIIGNRDSSPTGNDKTSIMFQLDHQPGSLARAMIAFQRFSVNLTWIESFPLPNRPNEYLFFVELEGHKAETDVASALTELASHTLRLEILGSYRRGAVD